MLRNSQRSLFASIILAATAAACTPHGTISPEGVSPPTVQPTDPTPPRLPIGVSPSIQGTLAWPFGR